MMDQVLGLDGGGTKTEAIVVDRLGRIIERHLGEGLDPTAEDGWETRLERIAASFGPVAAAVLGLPYHGEIAAVTARQTALAKTLFGLHATVMNDVAVAFEGAFAGDDGVLILAGTGSMAWARGPLGVHRVGGWGDAFGDEGSAYWIGREALALISQQLDGRKPLSAFADGVLKFLRIDGKDLIAWTYSAGNQRARIASLAAHVSDLAVSGDKNASILLEHASDHLAQLGLTAARLSGAPPSFKWSVAGGVMRDRTVAKALTKTIGFPPVHPILPPVGGAALAAAKAAGWTVDSDFIARLKQDLRIPEQSVTERKTHVLNH
jgi:glucosamine kinase